MFSCYQFILWISFLLNYWYYIHNKVYIKIIIIRPTVLILEDKYNFYRWQELDAGTELYFMVWDSGKDTGLGMNGSNVANDGSRALLEDAYNVKVLDAGSYTFTVDADKMEVSVTK